MERRGISGSARPANGERARFKAAPFSGNFTKRRQKHGFITFLFLLKDDLFPTSSVARSPVAGLSFFLFSFFLISLVSATLEPNFQLDYKY